MIDRSESERRISVTPGFDVEAELLLLIPEERRSNSEAL
jgi:hypothetical protein